MGGQRGLVLLIETDPVMREIAQGVMDDLGDVIQATDAREAIRLARERRPDLLIVDDNPPVLDAVAAIRCLIRDTATRDIPILALTATVARGLDTLSVGARDYLQGLYDPEEVAEKARALTRNRRAAA